MRLIRTYKWIVFLTLLSSAAHAMDAGGELLQRLNAIKTLSADFSQVVRAKSKAISKESGHMMMARPGHFRWEIKRPIKQLVLADGNKIWIYDPELEQVTIKPQSKAMQGTPALFLSENKDTLLDDFDVRMKRGQQSDDFFLKSKKGHPTFTSMVLSFKGERLSAFTLEDQLGQKTQIQLSNMKQNTALPARVFQFKPPRGVDVIRE